MYKAISKLLQGPLWLCGPSKAGVALLYLWEQLTRLTVWSVPSPQGRCLSFRGGKVCSTVPDVQICEVFLIPQVLMLTNLNSKKKVSGSWMLLTLTRLFGTCSVRTSTQLPLFVDGTCTSPHDHLVRVAEAAFCARGAEILSGTLTVSFAWATCFRGLVQPVVEIFSEVDCE